jgi:FtsH-binding integral membrane protein
VLWATLNLIIGYLLFRAGRITNSNRWTVILFFVGVLVMGVMLSWSFTEIHH